MHLILEKPFRAYLSAGLTDEKRAPCFSITRGTDAGHDSPPFIFLIARVWRFSISACVWGKSKHAPEQTVNIDGDDFSESELAMLTPQEREGLLGQPVSTNN